MTVEKKNRIYELVKTICATTTVFSETYEHFEDPISDVPTDNTILAANELLKEVGVSSVAEIDEIPLCWDNQVVIRFTLGKWNSSKNNTIFVLAAGVSKKNTSHFFFELYIENDLGKFPVENDDDMGIHLINDMWEIKDDRIVA